MINNYTIYIGYIAAVLTTISTLPQAYKIYKTNSTEDLSIYMYLLLTTGVFLWLIYGILLNDLPMITANFLSGLVMIYINIKIIINLIKK